MQTEQQRQTQPLIDLTCSDWEGARRARLEAVPRSATVGEVVGAAVRSMGLPFQDLYRAVFRGRELHEADTLEEIGIESDSEIELAPDVAAGRSARQE